MELESLYRRFSAYGFTWFPVPLRKNGRLESRSNPQTRMSAPHLNA